MTTYRNVDEIRRLADTLDALPDVILGKSDVADFYDPLDALAAGFDGYNQASWGDTRPDCGAYCCLAGWTMVNRYGRNAAFRGLSEIAHEYFVDGGGPAAPGRRGPTESITSHAARILGITPFEALILFGGGWRPRDADLFDASDHHAAAKSLRDFADGASIFDITHDWSHLYDYPSEADRSVVR